MRLLEDMYCPYCYESAYQVGEDCLDYCEQCGCIEGAELLELTQEEWEAL